MKITKKKKKSREKLLSLTLKNLIVQLNRLRLTIQYVTHGSLSRIRAFQSIGGNLFFRNLR